MDRQIREIRSGTAGRALSPLRYKDKGSAREAVQRAVYAYLPRARHAHEEYVNLVVPVLPDTFPLAELDQVDVEIPAFLKAPDNACALFGGGQYLCNRCAIFRGQSRVLVSQCRSADQASLGHPLLG